MVCWGYNPYGALGNGTATNAYTPVTVSGLSDAVQISGGYYHTCALRSTGAVVCWGNNSYGTIGNGTTATAYVPMAVTGLP